MIWLAHTTVATVVERQGRFLLVEELADGQRVFNQPAGHLEPNETLIEAAIRETREETGWEVAVQSVLGIYHYTSPANGITYMRICFIGQPLSRISAELDSEIVATHWLTAEEIRQLEPQWRSPAVWRVIADYQAGVRFPLSLISNLNTSATN